MNAKLMELEKLKELLGCEDDRTAFNWCKKNKIPILHLGKKKYASETLVDTFISEQIKTFIYANFENPASIIDAIVKEDKDAIALQLKEHTPVNAKVSKKVKANSMAAQAYIKKFKAA